ncbi:MAG TPA: FtsX-like permease family protein [Streptosporangiaceae bacterium]
MIRLGLRLTLGGGREAAVRLAVTAAAVALGVGMLLITLAGINAIKAQDARGAWLISTGTPASGPAGPGGSGRDPLVWLSRTDTFAGRVIERVDVAATGPNSPVPPGIPRLPGPGQFYASPALSRLLRTTPSAELGDRFPGHQAGTIGPSALPSPDSLVIVLGHTTRQLAGAPGSEQVRSITTAGTAAVLAGAGGSAGTLEIILAVAAVALLFPVLTFISTATRLAAARREQRFAAMRLAGATPRQVSLVSSVEASVAAVAGVAAGFGLFFLLRPVVARIPLTGETFFPGDLSLSLADILLGAVGVPVLAAVVARIALRRVQISPLGVSRRVTRTPPRAWRVIPLLAGIGELAYFAAAGHPGSAQGQTDAFFPGFLLLIVGLMVAGPWLTMAGSRALSGRARHPAALIAGRRLADNPRAAFRAVSGLILALFVASVATGIIVTLVADQGAPAGGAQAADLLVDQFIGGPTASGRPALSAAPVPAGVLARLRAIHGVRGVAVIYADLGAANPDTGLVSCAQLPGTPALGRCPAGARVAAVTPDFTDTRPASMIGHVWPSAAVPPGRLGSLPGRVVVVATNGSAPATERARTVMETAFPYLSSALTVGERAAEANAQITQWQRDADAVILASLLIAGCSLAVSVAAGLTDRKRPFSLLRLTGVPLRMLRRVVTLESAVPLLAASAIAVGTGLLGADLFLQSQFSVPLRSPGAAYYLSVLGGLVISFGIIAATLPLLQRITGPETARNE